MRVCSLTALLVFVLACPHAARAVEMQPVDCSSSPFHFQGEGYQIDCERLERLVRAEGSTGSARVDVMNISSDNPRMFLTVANELLSAPRLYMERRSLRTSLGDFFGNETIEAWKSIGNKNGYDTGEFTTEISGLPSQCIAIQRYTNPAWTGFKRHIVGMGCSPDGLAAVYDALAKLHAPGD